LNADSWQYYPVADVDGWEPGGRSSDAPVLKVLQYSRTPPLGKDRKEPESSARAPAPQPQQRPQQQQQPAVAPIITMMHGLYDGPINTVMGASPPRPARGVPPECRRQLCQPYCR
jgi:hypothetical protein